MRRSNFSPPAFAEQRGFTLIELMVAMVIGLFLIGGIVSVFVANQQSSRIKADLDNAQEAFRFASHTISRVVRLGEGLKSGSNDTTLIVGIKEGPGVVDCLGANQENDPAADPVVIDQTFALDGSELRCNGVTLVRGVESLAFAYSSNGVDYVSTIGDTSDPNWVSPTNVKVTMDMQGSGLSSTFSASLRPLIVALHGGGVDAGGTTPEEPGPEEPVGPDPTDPGIVVPDPEDPVPVVCPDAEGNPQQECRTTFQGLRNVNGAVEAIGTGLETPSCNTVTRQVVCFTPTSTTYRCENVLANEESFITVIHTRPGESSKEKGKMVPGEPVITNDSVAATCSTALGPNFN